MIQKRIVKLKAIVNKNSMRHLSYRIDLMKEIGSTWVVLWMPFHAQKTNTVSRQIVNTTYEEIKESREKERNTNND